MTRDKKTQLRSLVAERPVANYRELADAMQLSTTTIQRWVKRLGLPYQYGRK
jgi:transposase